MTTFDDLAGRATALSPTEMLRLDMWASTLVGLGDYPPMLVGSVLRRRDFRDVDVRLMVDDEDSILGNPERLRAINVAMSVWAQQVTGLPVDFQFQSRSDHAAQGGPMNPLGHRWQQPITATGQTGSEARDNGRTLPFCSEHDSPFVAPQGCVHRSSESTCRAAGGAS